MPLTIAPPVDQPVVSFASVGASAVPTIVGSAGWLREKRIGVAESAAGVVQSSTADLDLTGSTRFRYPGVPAAIGYAANAGQYVTPNLKPGASTQAAYWPFNVEFLTSSPEVEVRLNAPVANPLVGRVLVNGLPIVDVAGTMAATATAGGGYAMRLTFPDARPRIITLVALNNVVGRFGGVAVAAGYTVTKPTDKVPCLAIIGDSYVNGASPVGIVDTFAWRLASILGYGRNVILAGVGGTGYITTIGADPLSTFAGRAAVVAGLTPDVVLVAGARNDPADGLQAAAVALLDTLGNVPRYITNTSSNGAQGGQLGALNAAAASRTGVVFLEADVDALPKIADAVHPTQAGHVILADELAAAMQAAANPAPEASPWASPEDVILVLGKLGPRVASNTDIDLATFLSMGHAEALDRLTRAYGTRTLPEFTGDALATLRWAEAKLAAANVLDLLRVTLGDDSAEVPERLRRTAWDTLAAGVPGFRPGDPDPGDGVSYPTWTAMPAGSSSSPVSNFPNPYDDLEPALPVYVW